MNLKPEEISSVIKEQIERYPPSWKWRKLVRSSRLRTVSHVSTDLKNAMQGELLEFPGEVYGMVLNPKRIMWVPSSLGSQRNIRKAIWLGTTGRVVEVPVGDAMTGRVVNALGQPIDGKGPFRRTNTAKSRGLGVRRYYEKISRYSLCRRVSKPSTPWFPSEEGSVS